jgi:hypothetical protein
MVLLAQSHGGEALAEALHEPNETFRLSALAIIHHSQGHRAESDQSLRELIEKRAETDAFNIAEVHAMRGEADFAFEWLERAYAQRDGGAEIMVSRNLRSLNTDPRWTAFMTRIGLLE